MAGLSSTGFEIKRFPEVIAELKQNAITVFQDLVPPGDSVDTSDSSTIGRIIALHSPQYADLWELAQQVYSAFDPNSAVGIALDNLVALNGTVRYPASPTTADVVLWGSPGTAMSNGAEVRAQNGDDYSIDAQLDFNLESCIGFVLTLNNVIVGQQYVVDITRGGTTLTLSHTAVTGDTVASVLSSLYSQVAVSPLYTASASVSQLQVEAVSIYVPIVVVTNLVTVRVKLKSEARSQTIGAYPLDANTLTNILTPVLGWESVTNPYLGAVGSDEETDDELRDRFSQNKYISAVNINESLYSALINLSGVIQVRVVENNSDVYDPVFELPEHSFKPIVLGGDANEIAEAVWLNQPLGIGSEGNTEIQILDSQGYPQLISFERPEPVVIRIEIEIESTGTVSGTVAQDIKNSLIKYFEGMRLGQEVVYSRLFTPINETQGFSVDSLRIGLTAGTMGTSNIPMDYNQYAVVTDASIIVTET